MKHRLFLPCLLLLFIAVASQEKRSGVVHLGVNEGLSQGSVFDIEQDDKGFIWLATADGLNRFDGYNFELFNTGIIDSFPFAFTRLRNLFHTKDAIWVTSSQSMVLSRVDLVSGEVEKIYDFSRKGFGDICPFLLSGDTVWNLVSNEGVVALSVSQKKIIQQYPEAVNSFPTNNVCHYDSAARTIWYINVKYTQLCSFSLADKTFQRKAFLREGTNDTIPTYCVKQDHNGVLCIGSQSSIIEYTPSTGQTRFLELPQTPASAGQVCSIFPEGDTILWCGTNDGFAYRCNRVTGKTELKCDPAVTMNGVGHRIICLFMDRSRNMWIGTDPVGVFRIDTKQKPFHHTFCDATTRNGLKSNFMKCFTQMGDEMMIGTYDQGINVFNRRTGTYRYINGFGETQPVVYNVTVDSTHRLWACTAEGIGMVEPGSTHLTRPVVKEHADVLWRYGKTMYTLPNGTLLVGVYEGMYGIVQEGDSYRIDSIDLHANVESFYTDRDGSLWVGAADGIYFNRDGDPHKLERIITNTSLVKCMMQSADGTMWAGTDHGLLRLDAEHHLISKRYTEKEGMPNAFVYGILCDEEDNLWMSTNKGLTRFDPRTEVFRNYSVTDGLQYNEFNTNAYYKTTDGEFYFGGVNGFNHFYPSAIKDNPYVPECAVTGFKIFDKPWALDSTIEYKKQITLDYTNNNLLLEYTALEFSDPARNKFRYRLLGLDTNWVEAGDAHFARFVDLDPGEYTFQLKAANSDGVWGATPKELRITITPPFWQTAWFTVSVIVIALLLAFLGVRLYLKVKTREFRLKQGARMSAIIETEEKERKRIAEELHDGLGQLLSTARLNISGVEAKLEERDATLWKNSLELLDEACTEVRSISHNMMPGALIRSGLVEAINDLVNKIDDAGQLSAEFDTELEERFPETIEISVYRIVQEILNNMIRHAEAKHIKVSMQKTGNTLEVTITDDGKSFDVGNIGNSGGIGWKNIYSRVELLNGKIHITSEKGRGTSVFLSVSLDGYAY